MRSMIGAAIAMKPKALGKSANLNSRCSLPFLISQPARCVRAAASRSSLSFSIAFYASLRGGALHGAPHLSDFQADGAHQCERIAARNHPGAQPVVEADLARLELILEVNIDRTAIQRRRDSGQREIVRGHQADRATVQESAHQRLRPDPAVVRI